MTYPSSKELKDRTNWGKEHDRCFLCGAMENLETHEMVRRSQSPGRWAHRANYFRACQQCHAGRLAAAPLAFQLAVKWLMDRENYSRVEVVRILGRWDTAVTEGDVLDAMLTREVDAIRIYQGIIP